MRKHRTKAAALFMVCLLALAGCNGNGQTVTSTAVQTAQKEKLQKFEKQYFDYFDTFTTVTMYAPDQQTFDAYDKIIQDRMEEYHKLYDIYNDYPDVNNIKTINDNAGICPVKVEAPIIALLQEAVEMEDKTNGYMNVAMGSVLRIWHEYRTEGLDHPERAKLPTMKELQQAAQHIDISAMEIDTDNSAVYLPDPEMSLDVGSIAKGFATELVAEELMENGLTSGLLNVGGNVRTIGRKPDGNPWKVGVQNPDLKSEKQYLYAIQMDGNSLVTSGVYQRFYTVDGVNYHHIIQPELLRPWDKYLGVSILCEDSGLADCLSTAVFNMEPEQGKEFIESLDKVEAMWILPDKKEVFSSGFKKYIAQ